MIDYTYDAAGNKTEVSLIVNGVTHSQTTYAYDNLNRLDATTAMDGGSTGNAGAVTTYGYDAVGNRTGMVQANGTVTTYVYDNLNRLTDLTTADGLGAALLGYSYTLDPTGRRIQITESTGRTTDYTYDVLYRLTNESITDASNGNYSAAYTYDPVGNRTQSMIDGVTTAYTYDDNDRITQYGGTTYTYDDNGNTLTETLDGVIKTYTYNSQNELISVNDTLQTTSYQYNVNGIRTSQSTAGSVTDYLVDHNRDYSQVLLESENGTEIVMYVYGDDLISQQRGASTSFYHYDGLGSTRGLSDDSGSLINTYDYEAFGEVLNQTGSTLNNYLFTGEQFDSSLNQYYLRARYYNQNNGRFTQMDTYQGRMGEPATLHKYLYVHADPANLTDPTGNFGIGQAMTALNVASTLATVAQADYSSFISLGGESGTDLTGSAVEAGKLVLLSYGGLKAAKLFGRKLMKRAGCDRSGSKNLFCDLIKPPRQRIKKYRAIFGIGKKRNIAFADYITTSGFGTVVAHSGEFSQPGTAPVPGPNRRYQTGFVGTHKRKVDSEAKIYENLAGKFNSSTIGLVHLASERTICRSCGRVGNLFRGDHPRVFLIDRGGF